MKKVILFTENIEPPYDEGIKKNIYNLYVELNKKTDLLVFCKKGFKGKNIQIIRSNKFFYSLKIKSYVDDFKPDTIIYFPFASATFAGYLRMKIISKYYPQAKSVLIALQPKLIFRWQDKFLNYLFPDIGLTPSPKLKENWDKKSLNNKFLSLYTDLNKFKPIESDEKKILLRKKYQLPEKAFIISHMGHLNHGRNLTSLIPLQKEENQIVIVGSSSTPLDSIGPKSLKEKLLKNGIIIIDKYIENIEEIYQLSDLYIFPVVEQNSSIGMPLSILEARACGIPVLTTEFGSIKEKISDDFGSIFYSTPDEFPSVILKIRNKIRGKRHFTNTVANLNKEFLETLYSVIEK